MADQKSDRATYWRMKATLDNTMIVTKAATIVNDAIGILHEIRTQLAASHPSTRQQNAIVQRKLGGIVRELKNLRELAGRPITV
jgi:hypothetical protein